MDAISVGVDTTSMHKAFTYAALDRDLRLVAIAEADSEELVDFLRGQASVLVAVNSPSHVNTGIVRKRLQAEAKSRHAIRGADIREAELDLHRRGIQVSGTPHSEALCPAWVQLGFDLYRRLSRLGYQPYPDEQAPARWLETHPHAAFCSLLGATPLAKPSLEGRLQRALALYERGVRIPDPMNFLEEITRHRLLHGTLPTELLQTPEQLDALVAAYTAWLANSRPAELTRLGNKQEGFIMLPGPDLKQLHT